MSAESPKDAWVARLPNGEPDKVVLRRLVDADAARDEAENHHYEWASDPTAHLVETQQRRFRAQFRRRRRHVEARARENGAE